MSNILGLVSGNFKRHLRTHGIINTAKIYGSELAALARSNCEVCQRHASHLR